MRNTSSSVCRTLAPLLLVACHKILTGEDPTTSASTGGALDTTEAHIHSSTEPATGTTVGDASSGSGKGTVGASSSSGEIIPTSTTDPSTGPTTESETSIGNDDPESTTSMDTTPHCGDRGYQCDKTKDAECEACIMKWCGNGDLDDDVGEECDEGEEGEGANSDNGFCSKTCKRNGLIAFVSNGTFDGNLGGVTGANSICSKLASSIEAVKMPQNPKFRAWLSTGTAELELSAPNGIEPFETCGRPYYHPDGTLIATNQEKLFDGQDPAPILVTELGSSPVWENTLVWTATTSAGHAVDNLYELTRDCGDWTTNLFAGRTGSLEDPSQWTDSKQTLNCSEFAHIYCFEQAEAPCME